MTVGPSCFLFVKPPAKTLTQKNSLSNKMMNGCLIILEPMDDVRINTC